MNHKPNKSHKVNIITLGCAKNLVDSEVLMKQLESNQIEIVQDSDKTDAKTVIINTCGFIEDAKEESIETILQFVRAKEADEIEKLFVIGCLSERYKKELESEIPEVDQYFGVNDLAKIIRFLGAEYKKNLIGERVLITPKHYAYLKISEGCDRKCSFCSIPDIRGKHISRPIEDLVEETKKLAEKGVKEIIFIAQDLTYYGLDLYKDRRLRELISQISDIKGIEWIRLHYAFPTNFPLDILPLIGEKPNICKYIDIPVQHITDKMLNIMRRGISRKETYLLLEKIRKEIPDVALRTTIMVGHPGESEKDFRALKQFISEVQFDRLGVFTYSYEEDTYSYNHYKDSIPEKLKEDRKNEILEIQESTSMHLNYNKIGKLFKVIVDGREGEYFTGRTEYDSPEIDNEVIITNTDKEIKPGEFYQVKITDAATYDLFGEVS
ncbi:MAG: 30S ribosomal protein S12 methylthiotransferase RimO [Bacteroidales bacterium]|nr:30S ribosomal protein S12 methylthiotransferase RimO [Bacteroidales bacterium]